MENQFNKNREIHNNICKYKKDQEGKVVMNGMVWTNGRFRKPGSSYMSMRSDSAKNTSRSFSNNSVIRSSSKIDKFQKDPPTSHRSLSHRSDSKKISVSNIKLSNIEYIKKPTSNKDKVKLDGQVGNVNLARNVTENTSRNHLNNDKPTIQGK